MLTEGAKTKGDWTEGEVTRPRKPAPGGIEAARGQPGGGVRTRDNRHRRRWRIEI